MQAIRNTILTAVFSSAIVLTGIAPAQAQNVTLSFGQQQRVVQSYCDRNPRDRDCRGYYDDNWDNNDYSNFYRNRRSDLDPLAAGIFGLAIGAIVGGAIANGQNNERVIAVQGGDYDDHVNACYARYRSYDEGTDSFLGFDGARHRCNL